MLWKPSNFCRPWWEEQPPILPRVPAVGAFLQTSARSCRCCATDMTATCDAWRALVLVPSHDDLPPPSPAHNALKTRQLHFATVHSVSRYVALPQPTSALPSLLGSLHHHLAGFRGQSNRERVLRRPRRRSRCKQHGQSVGDNSPVISPERLPVLDQVPKHEVMPAAESIQGARCWTDKSPAGRVSLEKLVTGQGTIIYMHGHEQVHRFSINAISPSNISHYMVLPYILLIYYIIGWCDIWSQQLLSPLHAISAMSCHLYITFRVLRVAQVCPFSF